MTPGEGLRKIRKAAGLTQQQLADAIGMSQWSITQMERDAAPIERRTTLAVLAVWAARETKLDREFVLQVLRAAL